MVMPLEIDRTQFLRSHCTLPSLPEVVTKLQAVIQQPTTKIEIIVDLLCSDPALVAQLLKVVNSAYYALPMQVSNIRYAVAYLGLNEIYRMVLSLSVVNMLKIECLDRLRRFWFHSFYMALCTKYVAQQYEPHMDFDQLWSASILHDIGKLVYFKFFPDHIKAIEKLCEEEQCLFSQAEQKLGLPSSGFLGTLLCDHWRLPDKARLACECHTLHDLVTLSIKDAARGFLRTTCVGNLLALLANETLAAQVREDMADAIQRELGCSSHEFLTIMGDIYYLKLEADRFVEQIS